MIPFTIDAGYTTAYIVSGISSGKILRNKRIYQRPLWCRKRRMDAAKAVVEEIPEEDQDKFFDLFMRIYNYDKDVSLE